MTEKTRMTRDWIQRAWAANPCKALFNGSINTGPMRAAFCQVLGEKPKGKDGKERAWGVVLLLPDPAIPGVSLKPFKDAELALLKEKAPAALTNEALRAKFHDPFRKQDGYIDTKTGELYDGFVAGRYCLSANSSQTRPQVVDSRMAPIIDKSGVYSGCWVIANLNPGWINQTENKGPTFYLNGLMVVADDESLGGLGSANLNEAFAGVSIEAGDINADAAFGAGDKPSTVVGGVDIFG